MKFFDFFRKKDSIVPATNNTIKAVLPNGIELSPELSTYKELIEKTAIPFIKIEATPSKNLAITQSNFGGRPYWPTILSYPTDEKESPMFLLAQLNFAEIPSLQGYPNEGILQFFISANELFGVNFDAPTDQTNFRVVYHEVVNEASAEKEFIFLDNADLSYVPLNNTFCLSFSKETDYVGSNDVRFEKNFGTDLMSFAQTFGEKDDEIGE